MTITYTSLLGLTKPDTGTQSGTWGSDLNTGLTDYLDAAVAGAQVISGSQTAVTLSVTTGNSGAPSALSQAGSGATGSSQYQIIRCTGNPASTLVIDVPKQDKTYIVINATSTSQTVTLRGGPSTPTTGVNIVAGEKAVCAWNGSDFVKVGGAAGGTNTQVQYNNNGVFGGITNATTDGTTLSMTSPKVITSINDTNGAELLKVTATATAVNELTLANAATGNAPTLSATGDDTNIGINITPKGTGVVTISNLAATTIDTTNIEVTNIKAKDGTAAASIADSTGVITSVKDQVINGITVGRGAGAVSTNTAVGASALGANTGGSFNTAVGNTALYSNITGGTNTAVGYQAGYSNTTGTENLALGVLALYSNSTGNQNVAVGKQTLYSNTGTGNTATGYQAMYFNTSGVSNSAYGFLALQSNTTGSYNVSIGQESLKSNTTASYNTAVGWRAGDTNQTGTNNSYFGGAAGVYNTGSYNTAVGYAALSTVTNPATGGYNVAVGFQAATRISSGQYNVALGVDALSFNTTASNNTAVGYQAAYSNTTGTNNTAVGYQASYTSTTATGVTSIGYQANYSMTTTGNTYSTAVGYQAAKGGSGALNYDDVAIGAFALTSITSGVSNVAVGKQALQANTTGSNNTAVGYQAGYSTTGAGNVFVGHSSGLSVTSGANNVILGCYTGASQGGLDLTTASSYIALANGAGNGDWFAYVNGASTGNSWYQRSNSSSWATTSDARIKKNIVAVTNGLAIISALEPVEFDYILTNQHDVGFIAQDYQKVLPNQITQQDCISEEYRLLTNGEPVKGIQQNLVPYLVSAIQELKSELDTVKAELATLKGV